MRPQRVFFLTAARSDYDLMAPILEVANRHEELQVSVVVAGAHLSPFHGMNVKQIQDDGFAIAGTIETLLASESWPARALSCANLVEGLTRLLASDRPDLLFVAGDREEALVGALVANLLRIPVAHSHGGDRCIASDVDEILRPATSKLAHLHFTATAGHRDRLIRMGESADRVFAVGAAGLDRFLVEERTREEILAILDIDIDRPFFFVIHHPSPTMSIETSGQEMTELLDGVLALGHPVLVSYPNFDPGNIAIREVIDEKRAENPLLRAHHNLERRTFVTVYRHCAAIVGNSSSLLVEAGFLHVPAILVGLRQDLRERGPRRAARRTPG